MYDLFKNLFDKTPCSKNGICSTNPVLNSLEAVIVNEIRQIAFYVVKLKELNLTNKNLMKESVLSLSVSVYDMDFNKDSFIGFFKNILNTKNKVTE